MDTYRDVYVVFILHIRRKRYKYKFLQKNGTFNICKFNIN